MSNAVFFPTFLDRKTKPQVPEQFIKMVEDFIEHYNLWLLDTYPNKKLSLPIWVRLPFLPETGILFWRLTAQEDYWLDGKEANKCFEAERRLLENQ